MYYQFFSKFFHIVGYQSDAEWIVQIIQKLGFKLAATYALF